MAGLHLYVNLLSQPARAIVIFCRVNNIEAEVHDIDFAKWEHKSPEFTAINPMGQVPAIVDNGFNLFESHAILRYLATTKSGVPDHWYPSEPKQRARIDSILDWHHGNLRRGGTGVVFGEVIGPKFGMTIDPKITAEAYKVLEASLVNLEKIWLAGESKFLGGMSKPSIADISLACEVKQLQLLGAEKESGLLGPREKIQKWLSAVEEATAPHFAEAHAILSKF